MTQRLEILRRFEFFRGRLAAHEAQEIEEQIKTSPELQRDYEVDRGLFSELDQLARTDFKAPANFSQKVARAVRLQRDVRDREFSVPRVLGYSAAWGAVGALVVVMFAQLSDTSPGYFGIATSSGVSAVQPDRSWLLLINIFTSVVAIFLAGSAGIVSMLLKRWKIGIVFLALALGLFLSRIYVSASFSDRVVEQQANVPTP